MSTIPNSQVSETTQLDLNFSPQHSAIQKIWRCITNCRVMTVLFLLIISLTLSTVSVFFIPDSLSIYQNTISALLLAFSITLVVYSIYLVWNDLLKPILHIEQWSQSMRSGHLQSKIIRPDHGEFIQLTNDLNDLGTMMHHLSRTTDEQLQKYTEYNELKTQSLSILYDVAASINVSNSLDDLLKRFLKTLTEVLEADAGAIRLLNQHNQMELVASLGFDEDLIDKEKILPAESCACGKINDIDQLTFQDSLLPCENIVDHPFFGKNKGLIVVPLQYQGKTLGVYNLFVKKDIFEQKNNSDYRELFTSIGRHLGMAIAKARLDEESNKLSIMQERHRISYELHDSLAQTLTSIRFQVRVLDEILHQDDEATTWQQLEKIENTVDEANTELRSLIAHFQAPIRRQDLVPAIQDMVKRFRSESDIHIFFQHTTSDPVRLSDETHLEVIRIVQEALNNVRKHSEANVARVMVRHLDAKKLHILIEDDGVGLPDLIDSTNPGERIGLTSMKDRASRLNAELTIESDAGEGTRLILEFDHELKPVSPPPSVSVDTHFNLN